MFLPQQNVDEFPIQAAEAWRRVVADLALQIAVRAERFRSNWNPLLLCSTRHLAFLELRFAHSTRRPSRTLDALVGWHLPLLESRGAAAYAVELAGLGVGDVVSGLGDPEVVGELVDSTNRPTNACSNLSGRRIGIEALDRRDLLLGPEAALAAVW